uniref:Uncharacterized protein n=1 Tax=Globodera rostochiensis TaxID=31243 RepID=A0A914HAY0_GLORO
MDGGHNNAQQTSLGTLGDFGGRVLAHFAVDNAPRMKQSRQTVVGRGGRGIASREFAFGLYGESGKNALQLHHTMGTMGTIE